MTHYGHRFHPWVVHWGSSTFLSPPPLRTCPLYQEKSSCQTCGMRRSWPCLSGRTPPALRRHGECRCQCTALWDGTCTVRTTTQLLANEIFNLLLVLKARHLSGSAFCTGFSRLEVPEQALDGISLAFGLVVEINLLNFHAPSIPCTVYWFFNECGKNSAGVGRSFAQVHYEPWHY